MRFAAVGLAGGAIGVSAAQMGTDSVQGVIKMLQGMLTNSEAEAKEVAAVYDKTACACRDEMRDLTHSYEATQKEVERLTAKQKDLKGQSDALGSRIDMFIGVKSEMEAKVKARFAEIRSSTDDDQKAVNFAEETDSAEAEASAELENINIPYLKGEISADEAEAKKEHAKCEMRIKKCDDMIEACEKVLDILGGGQSKSIVSMVRKLKKQAFDKKTSIQEGDNECQAKIQDLEKSISSNRKFLALAQQNSDQLKADKAAVDAELGETTELLSDGEVKRDTLKSDMEATTKDCNTAATDYDKHSTLLTDEIAGLTGAIAALNKIPAPGGSDFVQIAQSTAQRQENERIDAALTHLASKATITHSPKLAALALSARMSAKSGAPDYFASIRTMIETMVTRLEEEQAAETSKTDWCKESLLQMKTDKEDSQTNFDTAVTNVRASEKKLSELNESLDDTNAELQRTEDDIAEMTALAADRDAMYTKELNEKNSAEAALEEAIQFLKDIYAGSAESDRAGGPSGTVKARSTNGGGVIKMLVDIKKDFTWDADVANMEVACKTKEKAATYKKRSGDGQSGCLDGLVKDGEVRESEQYELSQNILREEKRVEEKLKPKIAGLEKDISDEEVALDGHRDDRDEHNGLLDAAKAKLKARQEACVNAGDQFEARKKRREEEIASLKEALQILESHSKNSETGLNFLQRAM